MFEPEDDVVARVIQQLRRPVTIDPELDARVMREIAATPSARRRVWPWWSLLAAAAVLGALLITRPWTWDAGRSGPDAFQFVLVAPQAASVSLVGDFNDCRCRRRKASGRPSSTSRRGAIATPFS